MDTGTKPSALKRMRGANRGHDRDERRGHLPMTQSVRYDWERQGHRIPTPPPSSAGMVYAFQDKLSRGDASSSSGSGHAPTILSITNRV